MITSRQNALIKKIKSLKDKKFRDQENLYVAEGVKTVKTALVSNVNVTMIIGTEKGLSQVSVPNVIESITVSEDVFKTISGESTPQGVLAVIEKPKNLLTSPTSPSILLDGVSDPGNVGAIIRTAVASGYKTVYLTDDSADAFSPKSVRASMTGIFNVQVQRAERDRLLESLNCPLVIADMNGVDVFRTTVPPNFCLVIGNEANGVSDAVKRLASITVSIPMEPEMESLNASVSAGILMYALKQKL